MMQFRRLGRTEVKVGIIGLGTEYIWHEPREVVAEVVLEAIDNGINYMDVFMGSPDVRDNIGSVLKKRREEVLIAGHLGCYDIDGQYAKTRDVKISEYFLNDFYKRLRTDYTDILFLHHIDEDFELEEAFSTGGILDLALRLQKQGKARFIGFSSHKVPASFKALCSGYIDVFMYPVNPSFDALPGNINHEEITEEERSNTKAVAHDTSDRTSLYLECMQRDIGLVAMKPYASGRLFSLSKSVTATVTPIQCLSYALSRPGVSTVVPGCKNAYEVRAALEYLDASNEEKDHSSLIKNLDLNLSGQCMYCNHCQPCPEGIDIAAVTRLVDASRDGLTDIINKQYRHLKRKASDCKKCKTCEERCPFDVTAAENMERALKVFGD